MTQEDLNICMTTDPWNPGLENVTPQGLSPLLAPQTDGAWEGQTRSVTLVPIVMLLEDVHIVRNVPTKDNKDTRIDFYFITKRALLMHSLIKAKTVKWPQTPNSTQIFNSFPVNVGQVGMKNSGCSRHCPEISGLLHPQWVTCIIYKFTWGEKWEAFKVWRRKIWGRISAIAPVGIWLK